jgi:hypothetical protein
LNSNSVWRIDCFWKGMTSLANDASKPRQEQRRMAPSILGIGLDGQTRRDAMDFDALIVESPSEALERLKVLNIDLVIGGPMLGDDALTDMAHQLDQQFPAQRWAIIARELKPERERAFRALGSLGVFDELFTCLHFACPPGGDLPGPAPPRITGARPDPTILKPDLPRG